MSLIPTYPRLQQVKSSEIKEKMTEAEETEREIEARSNEYRPVAKRASLLYFCLADLAVVRGFTPGAFCDTCFYFRETTMGSLPS